MTVVEALGVLEALAREAAGETAAQCDVDDAVRVLWPLVKPKEVPCRD